MKLLNTLNFKTMHSASFEALTSSPLLNEGLVQPPK